MKHFFTLFILTCSSLFIKAQDLYLVKLKAKENTSNYINDPVKMLSQRALDRRTKYAIALDDSNNVYVTGESIQDTITFTDYATLKYNSNGILQWSNRYNGPFNGDDYANSIAIDSIGNVYVSGSIKDQFLYGDYAIIKYSRAGKEEWVKIYGGSSNFLDVPRAIIVDSKGNSYVTG